MGNLQPIIISFSTVSGIILLWLAYQGWQRRTTMGALAFMALMLAVAIWALAYAVEAAANEYPVKLAANALKYIGIESLGVAWLIFAGQSSGRFPHLQVSTIIRLSIVPAFLLLLRFTNDLHHLFFSEITLSNTLGFPALQPVFGPGFIATILYIYGFMLTGIFWLTEASFRSVTYAHRHTRLILIAVLIPAAMNLIDLVGLEPFSSVDMIPIVFVVSGILFERLLVQPDRIASAPISYQSVIENLPEAIIVIDSNNLILAVNAPLLTFLGRERSSLIGHPIREALHESQDVIDKFLHTPKASENITIRDRQIQLVITPLQDLDSSARGRLLLLRDHTPRYEAEMALQTYERRYRALFEGSSDAILILDLDYRIIIANHASETILRMSLADLTGREIQMCIAPASADAVQRRLEALKSGANEPLFQAGLLQSDGAVLPVEIHITLVRDRDGEAEQIQMIVRDISERERYAAELEQRLGQMAALRTVDVEVSQSLDMGRVLDVALHAATSLSGADAGFIALTRNELVSIQAVTGMYSPSVLDQRLSYDIGVVGRVLASHLPEMILDVSQDPDYFADIPETQALMAIPLISQDQLVGLINLETTDSSRFDSDVFEFIQLLATRLAIAVDNARLYDYVTRQLDELQQVYEELRRVESLKTDMLRIGNHDLKNPLAIARGYISLLDLDKDQFSEEHMDYVVEIGKALDRMDKILHDFLSMEAVNQRKSQTTIFDLRELVAKAADEFRMMIDQHEQTLTLHVAEVPAMVKGDSAQLYEAMSNLVSNAIKYTANGGTIDFSLHLEDYAVIFTVNDTGYGIPEDRQSHIFEPFYRSSTAETAGIEGTGIGLHLVKNIIDRHFGQVIFSSVYHQGSTFGFRLPLVVE